jgi:hypothetical protein
LFVLRSGIPSVLVTDVAEYGRYQGFFLSTRELRKTLTVSKSDSQVPQGLSA